MKMLALSPPRNGAVVEREDGEEEDGEMEPILSGGSDSAGSGLEAAAAAAAAAAAVPTMTSGWSGLLL